MSALTFGSKMGRTPLRLVVAVAIAAMLGVGAYAFTASTFRTRPLEAVRERSAVTRSRTSTTCSIRPPRRTSIR